MKESIPESVEALVPLIEDVDGTPEERRIAAVTALGNLLLRGEGGNPHGLVCLLGRLKKDTHPRVVTHCISVLARVKAYSAVMSVVDIVLGHGIALYEGTNAARFRETEESLQLRCAAIRALGRIGDDRAIIPLMSVLNNRDENYRLRLAAAESLGKQGDDHAVDSLIEIVSDDHENSMYLKESAVKALGMLGDIRAMEALINVLESKRGLRDKFQFLVEQAIRAIGRIGDRSRKACDSLLPALADPSPTIRHAAVEALATVGDESVIEPLMAMLNDRDELVARAAVEALRHVAGPEVIQQLLASENLPRFLREEIEEQIESLLEDDGEEEEG